MSPDPAKWSCYDVGSMWQAFIVTWMLFYYKGLKLLSQEVMFHPCGIFYKLAFERDDKSLGLMIKVYHTDNGVCKIEDFMDDLLKKQLNNKLSGAVSSY